MASTSGHGPAPRFSVVVPTFNRRDTLATTLESVRAQSCTDWELIVVDDGSTDGTDELVRELDIDRLRYLWQENHGVSHARNRGARSALGRYVTFLDTGDEARPHWLATVDETIDDGEVVFVSYGADYYRDGELMRSTTPRPHTASPSGITARFRAGFFVVDRSFFLGMGGYDEQLAYSESFDLALRFRPVLAERAEAVRTISEVLVVNHLPPATIGRSSLAYSHQRRLDSARRILDKHADILRHEPKLHETYLRLAGVASARLGHTVEARRYFWRAWRVRPRAVGELARAAATSVAPVRRRVWGAPVG
jgi:glycosyltransferase involved in cell wall biosynthesis